MSSLASSVTMHLTNAYHATSGGIRTFYHAALDAANREGRPFRLVVPAERSSVEDVGPCGRIYRIAAPASPVFDARYHLLLPHAYLAPVRTELRRILEHEQPALLEITDKYTLPWLAGLLRKGWIPGVRRPVLVGFSCERMDDTLAAYVPASGAPGRLAAEFYMRHLYLPLFDFHLAASEYIADELRAAIEPARRDRIAVRTLGVDIGRFDPGRRSPALRERLLEGDGTRAPDMSTPPAVPGGQDGARAVHLLLYAGRLSREKHVDLLVDLLVHLPPERGREYRLVIAGSGPLEPHLRARAAAETPGRIRFVPHVADRNELARLYASCDIFVHPNPREPFGIGPLEAMASGCALVAPRAGGVLTYASDDNAWLAEPSGRSLAAAVRSAAAPGERREVKVARARDTARAYDWPVVMRRLFGHYDDLIARGRAEGLSRR